MSFSDYPSQTPAGLWKVHMGSQQYRSWEWWLRMRLGKRFFPKPVMVVWSEWPPQTQAGADLVAKAISDLRASKHDGRVIGGASVTHPTPWDGYIPAAEE